MFGVQDAARVGIVMGIMTIIFGMLSLMAPGLAGVGINIIAAVALIATGMARLVFAFKADSFGSGVLVFLFGGLSIAAGVYMFASPAFGLGALTIALAIYFGVDGIVEIFASFQAKPAHGWGWVLLSGIASVFLAVLIMSSWPESASWAIGTLVGVRLLFAGFAMLFSGTFGEMASQDAIDAVKGN